ncbi:MAG: RNA polymerase sigma-70 factor [Chloroflexia bacterium]
MNSNPTSVDTFNSHRPLLFSIAYRMLGSAADAEDILQEAYLRWERASAEDVRSPQAYLTTIVTRLSIDQLRKEKSRRETYVGPWLPEPLMTSYTPNLAANIELAESLSMAFLLLLETLAPVERAVFLLREVFSYEYDEIAHIVGKSESNCRQIVRRAQAHLRDRRPRFPVSREHQEKMMTSFLTACANGDMGALVNLLTTDIVFISDGGGKAQAALNPIYGPDKVIRFLLAVVRKLAAIPNTVNYITELNGQLAVITYTNDRPISTLTLSYKGDRISQIESVLNPDKLHQLPTPPTSPPLYRLG